MPLAMLRNSANGNVVHGWQNEEGWIPVFALATLLPKLTVQAMNSVKAHFSHA